MNIHNNGGDGDMDNDDNMDSDDMDNDDNILPLPHKEENRIP